jgi:hypothetical protein
MGFCAGMVVTNTFLVFEKILCHCFSPKNFFFIELAGAKLRPGKSSWCFYGFICGYTCRS